ncbi:MULTISPECIES: DMT family transporter [unclassified Paraflavitalea]|uniref:DMT family transporter n=1 Tax=unclassified Paraflavitalea TaxID=2798305 RepID=UPI003D353B14
MSTKHTITFAGFLLAFVGSLFFSTKAIMVKYAFGDVKLDAVSLLALRMFYAVPMYAAVLFWLYRKERMPQLKGREWIAVLGLGCMGYYVSSYLDFVGLQFVSAGLERLILFLYPTFVLFINHWFLKHKMERLQVMAIAITYLGLFVAYAGEVAVVDVTPNFILGSVLIFLCAITYAIYIAGSGKIIPKVGATAFTAYAMLAASFGVLLHFFVSHPGQQAVLWNERYWIYGVLLSVVATVLPSFMISGAMKRIGSNNVAIISSIGPVSTILQAHFILNEPITVMQVLGTVLVIVGVLMLGRKK